MRRSLSPIARVITFVSLALFFFSSSSIALLKRDVTPPATLPPVVDPPASSVANNPSPSVPPPASSAPPPNPVSVPATSAAPAPTSAVQSPAQPTTTAAAATTAAQDPTTQAPNAPTSTGVTTTVTFSSAPNINPQSTLHASFSFSGYLPSASSPPGAVVTAPPLSATAKGFWHNKSAVGATFTFVTLIALVVAGIIAATVIKRRRRARRRRQRHLERYNAAQAKQVAHDASTDGHFEDPEPAVIEPMAPAPTDAYPDRQVHYGATPMSQVNQNGYDGGGVGYILGTDYASQNNAPPQEQTPIAAYYQGPQQQPGGYQQTGYQQGGAGYGQPTQYTRQSPSQGGYGQATQYAGQTLSQPPQAAYPAAHPYNQPQNMRTTGLAPPVAQRQPAARGNGYDRSIDSFYGASGANDAPTHAV